MIGPSLFVVSKLFLLVFFQHFSTNKVFILGMAMKSSVCGAG